MKKIICITGIDGCGKSTQIQRLARWLGDCGLPVPPVLSVWEIARNSRYRKHPFISDRKAVHQYLSTLHGGPRALFIFHALLESLTLTEEAEGEIILADGFWHKYAFTEHLHGENLPWLTQVAGRFPKPIMTILLDIDPKIAWKRKPEVTAYECGFNKPSEENFVAFQTGLRKLFQETAQLENWEIISAEQNQEDLSDNIVQILNTYSFVWRKKTR